MVAGAVVMGARLAQAAAALVLLLLAVGAAVLLPTATHPAQAVQVVTASAV